MSLEFVYVASLYGNSMYSMSKLYILLVKLSRAKKHLD